jgi:uncharacterized protein YdhG (YjbR/CyaY superfamily)
MQSKAKTPSEYIKSLPAERRQAISKVRRVIKKHLPKGYVETMQYGMLAYVVPLKIYPDGYLDDKKTPLPYVSLASQKQHMAVYLSNIYGEQKLAKWFKAKYKKSGKKMDMGKSCVRFRKLDDLPLELIGQAVGKTSVKDFIKLYEQSRKK